MPGRVWAGVISLCVVVWLILPPPPVGEGLLFKIPATIIANMKFHMIFIAAAIALVWAAMYAGYLAPFWARILGILLGFFGFLLVFMLTDEISDAIRLFGVDLIVIAIGLLVIWV